MIRPAIHGALAYRVGNLVERRHHGFEIRLKQFAGQISGSHCAGNRDALSLEFFRLHGTVGDDHRAIPVADAGTAGHQNVFVGNVRVGVIGNGAEIVNAFHGLPI